ncbi:MAG TPA: response regulator, partial [Bacteroidota bacterium]
LFERMNPTLVILDIRLPSMSSDEVFSRIKKSNPNARIITTSAYTSGTTSEEQKMRGAESFYDKATQSEHLIADIKAALRNDKEDQLSPA